ncbi:MAG TPA: hypothetical protein VFP92_10660 [Rhodanobacteraceae bacterium]|nr:hypothetical protein [Rhodanobacteraceae bacterium]
MNASLVHILTRYACDMHPRVTEDEMQRAITDTENRYGCDADDFTPAMENDAISLAVERRIAHEQDWFDGSEDR